MKLSKKQLFLVSFMLFSLFFGAGNLIFPPFLGQNAGTNTPIAFTFFLITAVLLPVMGVIVVAKFNDLETLASKVNPTFALIFTFLIYLSIGPGLGIPRAASVPFELAIAPYLPQGTNLKLFMLLYSAIFFIIATWLALTPNKLVERIGKFLTPSLLCLISLLFISFIIKGDFHVSGPVAGNYANNPAITGFIEGYNTMDAIAALNFGLVISLTIKSFGINDKKDIMHNILKCGLFAGAILSFVYFMLSFMGMNTSALYPIQDNGAWTLRCIVKDTFGEVGAILLASIFTLACLTTCVGLITSISQYFSRRFPKLKYNTLVIVIALFSFIICNQGLNMILSISVPVLNMIYPIAIILIIMGLCDKFYTKNKIIYPLTVGLVGLVSVIYSLDTMKINLGFVTELFELLPFYSLGLGWVIIAIISIIISILLDKLLLKKN